MTDFGTTVTMSIGVVIQVTSPHCVNWLNHRTVERPPSYIALPRNAHGCSVLEINTTDVRSGTPLKNAIEEASKSSSLETLLGSMTVSQDKGNYVSVESSSKHPQIVDSDSDP